jgi:hypothetical protein
MEERLSHSRWKQKGRQLVGGNLLFIVKEQDETTLEKRNRKGMRENLKIGQKLYQNAYSKAGANIVEYEIESIGKKYIYLKNASRYPINKNNLMYESKNYSGNKFQLYLTREEIIEENDRRKYLDILKRYFNNYSNTNTLDELRQASEILKLTTPEGDKK